MLRRLNPTIAPSRLVVRRATVSTNIEQSQDKNFVVEFGRLGLVLVVLPLLARSTPGIDPKTERTDESEGRETKLAQF
jgi:hypothetical protein